MLPARVIPYCLLLSALPLSVQAEPAPGALTVHLQLVSQAGRSPAETLSATVALAGDHGCGVLSEERGAVRYDLNVCRDGGDPSAPVLNIDISRDERTAQSPRKQRLRLTSRVRASKPVVVGDLQHGDGSLTRVTARVE